MDPHSRLSQFNQRRPSTGPRIQQLKKMESKPSPGPNAFEQFRQTSTSSSTSSPSSTSTSHVNSMSAFTTRPIASNSRLRRDERYMRNMHLAFVDNALDQKAKGNNELFSDLVRLFSPQNIYSNAQEVVPQLRSYLTALSHVVSKLDRAHISLIDAIVHMPWTILDSVFVKAYISFMGMLVSARPEYLNLVSEQTAQSMTFNSGKRVLSQGFAESSSKPLTRRIVYDRVHSLIQQLLSLIPTLPATLYPLLARHFPHKRQPLAEHVTYVRNLLRLSDYCPELCDRLLGLTIDRTIQIDVEIQVELEELEAAGEEVGSDVFPVDVFDTVIGQEENESDSDDGEDGEEEIDDFSDLSSEADSVDDEKDISKEPETDTKQVLAMVSKLDGILEVIFKHLNQRYSLPQDNVSSILGISNELTPLPTFDSDDTLPPQTSIVFVPSTSPPPSIQTPPPSPAPIAETQPELEARRIAYFHSLLSIFETTILRTFKSRYTQFLLFWYSSLSNTFRDRFLGTVMSKVLQEVDQPVVTRAAAASYVASYVSRANFVDRDETRTVVRLLCRFVEVHLNEFDEQALLLAKGNIASSQSAEQHAVFYATVQAVFLIFCFRWRDLLEHDPNDNAGDDVGTVASLLAHKTWLPELNVMQRAVSSLLNPLKVCSSNVVLQFAVVAQKVGFMYCFSVIEANKRAEFLSPSSNAGMGIPKRKDLSATPSKHTFVADLSTFFPFDPYRLPRSASYMEGIYRDWTAVAIDEDEDGEGEEEEEEDFSFNGSPNDGDMAMHGPSSFADDAHGLGKSFGGMSISPVRHVRTASVAL